ncbi:hypothetical protein GCM10010169_49370 [Micromonospora fulviviridis]|uniref:hypothetical protein n=1 Tax=Micromonospora fulviviridis TaxID=47860 RepID=UPI00166CC113|nr:hypothetical protein [Micromonospora fulviviridis]GGR98904.1 hypothetical protein GCM10010169_49370 [Micromonospora fulviviridis]
MTEPYPNQQPQQPYQQGSPGYPPQQYQPADPGQPQPTGFVTTPPPTKPNRRKPLLLALGAALAVLVLTTAGLAVYEGFIKEDSGVAACKAMRDGTSVVADDKSGSDDKMTEAEYREVRELFEDSRHEKLREHGTALVDIVWQVSNLPEGEEMGALAFIGPMGTHVAGLQTACADQGVIVNLNKK